MSSEAKQQKMNENSTDQSISIVWLDSNITSSEDGKTNEQQLRGLTNDLQTFADIDNCEKHLQSQNKNIIFIVSGQLGENLVRRVHELEKIIAIYIFCNYKEKHEKWSKSYAKVFVCLLYYFKSN